MGIVSPRNIAEKKCNSLAIFDRRENLHHGASTLKAAACILKCKPFPELRTMLREQRREEACQTSLDRTLLLRPGRLLEAFAPVQ